METGTSTTCEQPSSLPTPGEITDFSRTATASTDSCIIAVNTHSSGKLSTQQTITQAKKIIMTSPITCHNPNAINQRSMNTQTRTCVPFQPLPLNVYPVTVQTLAAAPHRRMNNSCFNSSNPSSDIMQNQNIQNISRDLTTDGQKTTLHSLSLSNSRAHNENMNSDQYFFSSPSQDFLYKRPKSLSPRADYEITSGTPSIANASTTPLAAHDLNLVHSVSSERTLRYATKTSRVPETTFHGLTRNIAPASARSPLPPSITRHDQPLVVADATGNGPLSPLSITNTLPGGGGSVSEYPSPQVSEDKHISVSQQSFAQTYASLTPWTSKLTAPGYVPLPAPAPDAMPFALEHTTKEYVLSIPPPSHQISAKSWHTRPYQVYSHLGCYSENQANRKTKSGIYSGALQTQRAGFKVLSNKEHRFRRTAEALQKSGLWEVAMKTGSLIKRNRELQKELEEFRSDAVAFLKSVIKNPQNRGFIKNVLNTALTSNAVSRNGSSVMTVVVSAAAAAAAASVRLDSSYSSDGD